MWMESEMLPPLLPTDSIARTHPQAPAVGKPSPCQSLLGPQSAEKTLRNKFTYQEIPHELSPGATRLEVLAATHAEHRAGGSHAAPWQGERGKRPLREYLRSLILYWWRGCLRRSICPVGYPYPREQCQSAC